jgi:hypothetical protein
MEHRINGLKIANTQLLAAGLQDVLPQSTAIAMCTEPHIWSQTHLLVVQTPFWQVPLLQVTPLGLLVQAEHRPVWLLQVPGCLHSLVQLHTLPVQRSAQFSSAPGKYHQYLEN